MKLPEVRQGSHACVQSSQPGSPASRPTRRVPAASTRSFSSPRGCRSPRADPWSAWPPLCRLHESDGIPDARRRTLLTRSCRAEPESTIVHPRGTTRRCHRHRYGPSHRMRPMSLHPAARGPNPRIPHPTQSTACSKPTLERPPLEDAGRQNVARRNPQFAAHRNTGSPKVTHPPCHPRVYQRAQDHQHPREELLRRTGPVPHCAQVPKESGSARYRMTRTRSEHWRRHCEAKHRPSGRSGLHALPACAPDLPYSARFRRRAAATRAGDRQAPVKSGSPAQRRRGLSARS